MSAPKNRETDELVSDQVCEEEFAPGTPIGSGFVITRKLGSGGKATVYLARDLALQEDVAIKVWHHALAASSERIRREAKITASLSHPGIVRVKSFGLEGDTPYLIMEYVNGPSLEQRIAEKGPFNSSELLIVFRAIAEALRYAHQNQVLHRDIKPANIVLADGEMLTPKLVDFGLSRISNDLSAAKQHLTSTEAIAGSPAYMSPEQCQGKATDVRSDIYSLAVAMFEAATGKLLFEEASELAVMAMHVSTPAAFPQKCKLDKELQGIILTCLRKDASERYQSADDLCTALAKIDTDKLVDLNQGTEPGAGAGLPQHLMLALGLSGIIAASAAFFIITARNHSAQTSSSKSNQTRSLKPLGADLESADDLIHRAKMDFQLDCQFGRMSPQTEQRYLNAIRSAKREKAADEILVCQAYYADYLNNINRKEEARKIIDEALLTMKGNHAAGHVPQAIAHRAAAEIYAQRRDGLNESLSHYQQALLTLKSNDTTDTSQQSALLEGMSHSYRLHHNAAKAIDYLKKAIAADKADPDDDREAIRRCLLLALLVQTSDPKLFDTTMRNYEQQKSKLEVEEKERKERVYTEAQLCKIATRFSEQGRHDRAIALANRAWQECQDDRDANPNLKIMVLATLTQIHFRGADKPTAAKHYRELLKTCQAYNAQAKSGDKQLRDDIFENDKSETQ